MNSTKTKKIIYYFLATLLVVLCMSLLDKSHDVTLSSLSGMFVSLIIVLPALAFNLAFFSIPIGIFALIITLIVNYFRKEEHYIELLDSPMDVKTGKFLSSVLLFSKAYFFLFVLLFCYRLGETYLW